ncbi:MAG: histidinol dehydrogenase [Flammeovirgaceae bacterium]|nr:histidinol dehydrogenase [Flammeovirgaceae bacterium]
MIPILYNPPRTSWPQLTARPSIASDLITGQVQTILQAVRAEGNNALLRLTSRFDGVSLTSLQVLEQDLNQADSQLSDSLKQSISIAAENINRFHKPQKDDKIDFVETMPGVICWRKAVPVQHVGLYVPGGSAPLFSSVLMLGIPARIAGCKDIVLCSPPDKNGKINPAILFAAKCAGIRKVFIVGGAQAIAAMAYGTETIPRVDKIFGPGNQFVTKAKEILQSEGVAIDLPAGPSEVLIWADHTGQPNFIAADLLSQAEHGPDSQVAFLTTERTLMKKSILQIEQQLEMLPRKKIAEASLSNSKFIVFDSTDDIIDFINSYAPEHLIINTENADQDALRIDHAGSVFIGNYTPEAVGDYASGTNHTLPTSGSAKAYSGVSVDSFMKYITYQRCSKAGLERLAPVVEEMAEAENLMGHKRAIQERMKSLNQDVS